MRTLSEEVKTAIAEFQSFSYCFIIKLSNGRELYLTSSSNEVIIDGIRFLPESGLTIPEALFNDSGQNYLILEGIFEKCGISMEMELTGAEISIIVYFTGNNFYYLLTWYCSLLNQHDLSFRIRLEPEAVKYGKSLLQSYSKTCRAVFGDSRCKMDKKRYAEKCLLVEINGNSLKVASLDKEDGYFNEGEAFFPDNDFRAKIRYHLADNIEIFRAFPETFHKPTEIILTPGCDGHFITCCNKFDNALNFRGEPFVPEYNILSDINYVKDS